MKNTLKLIVVSVFFLFSTFNFQAKAQSKTPEHPVDNLYTGLLTQQELVTSPYTKKWYVPKYKQYSPEQKALTQIKNNINKYNIVVFMGVWCHDSRRVVPKLYKLLQQANYNMDHIKMYALNYYKKSKKHYERGLHITHVPTIIFYENGKEVNRFVESSRQSLAKDIAKIVTNHPYKNIYAK